jgi:hypothetical protein
MKLQFTLLGLCSLGLYAAAAPHTWILNNGDKIEGEYVGITRKKVFIINGSTNYAIKISEISTNDLAYIAQTQVARRQARLDREAKRLAQSGMIELTAKRFDNVPDKPEGQPCWLDAEFIGLNELWTDPRVELGFSAEDKNSDLLAKCFVEKELHGSASLWGKKNAQPNPLVAVVSKLQRGDRARFTGKVVLSSAQSHRRLFQVEKVELIESAIRKSAGEDAAEDLPSPGSK